MVMNDKVINAGKLSLAILCSGVINGCVKNDEKKDTDKKSSEKSKNDGAQKNVASTEKGDGSIKSVKNASVKNVNDGGNTSVKGETKQDVKNTSEKNPEQSKKGEEKAPSFEDNKNETLKSKVAELKEGENLLFRITPKEGGEIVTRFKCPMKTHIFGGEVFLEVFYEGEKENCVKKAKMFQRVDGEKVKKRQGDVKSLMCSGVVMGEDICYRGKDCKRGFLSISEGIVSFTGAEELIQYNSNEQAKKDGAYQGIRRDPNSFEIDKFAFVGDVNVEVISKLEEGK